ncbi:MAG: ion transporter [Prevotella sp.]|nr:ion transporter [Prevotella sp.]
MNGIRELFCNERIILTAIVLNTIILFFGGFWPNSLLFDLSDAAFTLIFACEAMAKISKYGWKNYWRSDWNKFDFIILFIALPSLAGPFIELSMGTNAVLALRSMRLFKSFKMLRFIPNIQKLLKGLKLAVKASFLVLLAFIVMLVIFSILSATIFGNIAPEYFGNPAISLYSIFRLFSIEGWYELPDAIAANSSPSLAFFARCYFSILMFLGGIIGMSLINSIFVDAMVEDNNDEVLEKLSKMEKLLDELKKK